MFKKDANGIWNESQIIKVAQPAYEFGHSVSLDNNLLLVNSPTSTVKDNGANVLGVGLNYLFSLDINDEFKLVETIQTSQAIANMTIGYGMGGEGNHETHSAIAINGNRFILGAPSLDFVFQNNTIYNMGVAFISGDVNSILAEDTSWTGADDTNWNNPLNWSSNAVPTQVDDVIINDVANAPVIENGQNHSINNLTNFDFISIESNASLNILGNLDQRREITINSSINENGSLLLNGIQTNPAPSDTNYLRYISGNSWHLIASPLTNVDIDVFAAANPLAEGQVNNRGLGFYNNNIPAWEYYQAGAMGTGNFVMGRGSSINVTENTFLSFTGKIKSTELINYVIDENENGWNLVGNPYPAFINANSNANAVSNFLSENINSLDPLAANVYLWNPNTTSYDPIGNGLGAKYVAPGQGFFVKAKAGGSTINIEKSMLSHQEEDLFLKETPTKKIVLQVNNKTSISETTIAFKNGMKNGLDVSYDAAVFSGVTSSLSIYSQLIESYENTPFAIQFLPELNENNTTIPLGILHEKETEMTFSLKESNLDSTYKIYLEDKLLNTFSMISITEEYTFSHKQNANGLGRFFLHIQKNALNLDSTNNSTIKIYKKNNHALQVNGINEGWIKYL